MLWFRPSLVVLSVFVINKWKYIQRKNTVWSGAIVSLPLDPGFLRIVDFTCEIIYDKVSFNYFKSVCFFLLDGTRGVLGMASFYRLACAIMADFSSSFSVSDRVTKSRYRCWNVKNKHVTVALWYFYVSVRRQRVGGQGNVAIVCWYLLDSATPRLWVLTELTGRRFADGLCIFLWPSRNRFKTIWSQ